MHGVPAVVLLSGGLDSATTLALAIERGYAAYAMSVDYGQRQVIEIDRAARLAESIGARNHRVVRVDLSHLRGSALTDPAVEVPAGRSAAQIADGIPVTYVPARNALFLCLALGWAETLGARDLFIGANSIDYSGYPDCRPEFLSAFEAMARLATRDGVHGRVPIVHAPLMRCTKGQIVREALRLGVDLGLTLSCYAPANDGRPCGECDACILRRRGFQEADVVDPAAAGTE